MASAHNQIGQLQQKLHKKVLKHEAKIDDLKEEHSKQIRKLQKELLQIQQINNDLEVEVFSYRKQRISPLTGDAEGRPLYEDRIKQLLLDLEG